MRDEMPNPNLVAPELAAVDINGITREAFILRSALAAGAVYGLGSVGPFVHQALAQASRTDVEILNFALTLEHLEAAFYEQGNADVADRAGPMMQITDLLEQDEKDHVEALTRTIKDQGGTPVKAPEVAFGDNFADSETYLKLAQTLEDTGIAAYNGQGPLIRQKEILAAVGSIVQVEGRHAAAVRTLQAQKAAPNAFDKPLSKQKALDAVKPYLAGGSDRAGDQTTTTPTGRTPTQPRGGATTPTDTAPQGTSTAPRRP